MGAYESLKKIWKKLGVNGQVKNFSSKRLWVLAVTKEGPLARWLEPGFKTPPKTDIDAFKRADGGLIERHDNWWKFYDFSTVEIFDREKLLEISVITKTAVDEKHFGNPIYLKEKWGSQIKLVTDIKRDKETKKILAYYVSNMGWISFQQAFEMCCYHEIDNGRPVFPETGQPYIRTRRDNFLENNIDAMGRI